MTGTGLVKLTLPAGLVHNAAGTGNAASTGSTNNVFYDINPATEALVNPAVSSTVLASAINAQKYIIVSYSAQTGVGLNTASITDAGEEFSLSGAAASGVAVNGAAISMGNDQFGVSRSPALIVHFGRRLGEPSPLPDRSSTTPVTPTKGCFVFVHRRHR